MGTSILVGCQFLFVAKFELRISCFSLWKKKVTNVQSIRFDKWNVKVINNQKSYIKFWTIWLKQLYESNIIKWNITEEHIEAGLQNEAVLTYLMSFSKLNIQKTKVMASSPITLWQIDGETVFELFFWAPKSLQMVTAAMKLKDAYSLEGKLWPTQTAYWKAETLLC